MIKKIKGFTIVEMVIVISVMAVLGSITGVTYSKLVSKSKVHANEQELLAVVGLVDAAYMLDEEYEVGGTTTLFDDYATLSTELLEQIYAEHSDNEMPEGLDAEDGILTYSNRGLTVAYDLINRQFIDE